MVFYLWSFVVCLGGTLSCYFWDWLVFVGFCLEFCAFCCGWLSLFGLGGVGMVVRCLIYSYLFYWVSKFCIDAVLGVGWVFCLCGCGLFLFGCVLLLFGCFLWFGCECTVGFGFGGVALMGILLG